MTDFIFVAPRYDEATVYSFQWCKEVEQYAMNKGFAVIILNEDQAIRDNVEYELDKHPHAILIHFDHGNEDCIWGQNEKVVDLENNKLLTNRKCFSMSCLSAKTLGADSYLRYATIYFGSIEVISFTTDSIPEFGEALTFPAKMVVNGEFDWNKILDETIKNDNKIIDKLMNSGKFFAAALLTEDRAARRVWTDKTPPPDQPSTCTFRRMALKLFGQKGWRIRRP